MKKRRFLISGLAAAGIVPFSAASDRAAGQSADNSDGVPTDSAAIDQFAGDHFFQLAQHRSHSSHGSHRSHRSSSSSSSVPRATPPAPRPTPTPTPSSRNSRSTPPSSVLPSSSAISPRQSQSGDAFTTTVRRVQEGLRAFGYYRGAIDGIVGPETRAALVRFQTDYDLSVTGTVTPEVLDALGISSS